MTIIFFYFLFLTLIANERPKRDIHDPCVGILFTKLARKSL